MKKYDIVVIGMGPAGMAVSAMASAMGLKVVAIENDKIGGECLNVGCIPSKALLKAGEANKIANNILKYGIKLNGATAVEAPLQVVREKIKAIGGNKTMKVFDKVDLIQKKGMASFVDDHTVEVNGEKYYGKKIFIGTGTHPFIPPIPGLKDVPRLTNMNLFDQKEVPSSLTIIGGGAIGVEMAQAFSRLGCKVTLVHMDKHLLPAGDHEAGELLQQRFEKEGITVYNATPIHRVEEREGMIVTHLEGLEIVSEKILVATGRQAVLKPLKLENAGIKYTPKGIIVNQYMRTNKRHVYAVGDCNGLALLSHAAMHQGMLALMNAMNPLRVGGFKRDKYLVPWSVFTKPEIAHVGLTEAQAIEKGLDFEVIKDNYEDYGRNIADGNTEGFVKVIANKKGRIYGATIVGEAGSEMIHEWVMAIQHKVSLFDIMMMQHSFPTISLMNKRVAEKWMMNKMGSPMVKRWAKRLI